MQQNHVFCVLRLECNAESGVQVRGADLKVMWRVGVQVRGAGLNVIWRVGVQVRGAGLNVMWRVGYRFEVLA